MRYSLRAVNTDGTMPGDGFLPDWTNLGANIAFSDIGDVDFEYAINGANTAKLVQQQEIAVFDDTGEVPDTRFQIEDRNGNLVSRDGVLYRKWQGRTLWKMFADAIVYPSDWPANPSATGSTQFASATAGAIISSVINAAQARGELTGITLNFGAVNDGAASAWIQTVSIEYKAGTTVLQVIQDLVDKGVVECRMVGRNFQAYKPNTLGTDRTLTNPQFALWAAENVYEVPEQEMSRDLKNAALVAGDNNHFVEVTDATSIAAYTRRAMFVNQGGVEDTGTLTVVGQAAIDKVKQPRKERTTKFSIIPGKIPQRSFFAGDWIYSEAGGVLERMRVRQVVIEAGDGEDLEGTCTVVLNDRFMELEVLLNRQVDSIITGGVSQNDGVAGAPDALAPKVPAGLGLVTAAYVDSAGATWATVTASWLQVTQNSDNSVCDDLDAYVIKIAGNAYVVDKSVLSFAISGVTPGTAITAQVGAYDKSGNFSGFSSVVNITAASDTTPPPVPKTPVAAPYLGQVRIAWDGTGSAGEAMPSDFAYTEVHINTVNNFTPTAATMIDQLVAAGASIATGLTYGTTYYVKLISVDHVGNKSAASAQASAVPIQVTGGDIANGQIGYNSLAFKDWNNLAADGSFENTSMDTQRTKAAAWSYVTSLPNAFVGSRFARVDGATNPSTSRKLYLTEYMDVRSGDKFWLRSAYKRAVGSNGNFRIIAEMIDTDALLSTATALNLPTINGSYNEASAYFAPGSTIDKVRFYAELDTAGTTGLQDLDGVEIRQVQVTVLIDDAAITNAKIANLAVDDAKIGSVSAGKITVGSLVADVTVSARIKTADTGARVELNSTGLKAFNSGGTMTVNIANTGAAYFQGVVEASTLRTGTPGGSMLELLSQSSETVNGGLIRAYSGASLVSYLDLRDDFWLSKNGAVNVRTTFAALVIEAGDGVNVNSGHLSINNAGHYLYGSYLNMTADGNSSQPAWIGAQNGDNYLRWWNPASITVGGASNAGTLITGNGAPIQVNGTTSVITTVSSTANAFWNSVGVLVKVTSSKRFKQDVFELAAGRKSRAAERVKYDPQDFHKNVGHVWEPKALLDLKPYSWRALDGEYSDSHLTWAGFLAEDVSEKFPYAAMYDADGVVENYNDRAIIAAQNDLIKDLYSRVEALEASK